QFNGRLECPTHNRHADRHDHHAQPDPTRHITFLDDLRARLRWHHLRTEPADPDNDDDPRGPTFI
ncbi:MAG: hypothetical protein H0U21_14235, partial [Acidimicrobiia bacterium]|nr:hypothetical protein [Acidimicrobiia bacterium]